MSKRSKSQGPRPIKKNLGKLICHDGSLILNFDPKTNPTIQCRDANISLSSIDNGIVKLHIEKGEFSLDRIINAFWKVASVNPVLIHKIFKPRSFFKEMIESTCAIEWLYIRWMGANANCYILGDGIAPRTGGLCHLAFPNYNVISIDPAFDDKWIAESKDKFTCVKDLAENVKFVPGDDVTIFISVHGHAPLKSIVTKFTETNQNHKVVVITIPCCHKDQQLLDKTPTTTIIIPTFNLSNESSNVYIYEF